MTLSPVTSWVSFGFSDLQVKMASGFLKHSDLLTDTASILDTTSFPVSELVKGTGSGVRWLPPILTALLAGCMS